MTEPTKKRRRKRKPLEDRFWSKVNKTDTCWLWTGATRNFGYGHINRGTGRPGDNVAAHRLSWELANGRPVPDGLFVLHKCNTPACVNPEHLEIGNRSENTTDASRAGTHNKRKLSEDEVRAIRARYAAGDGNTYTLAEEYGVHQRAVWEIVNGRTYKWLT